MLKIIAIIITFSLFFSTNVLSESKVKVEDLSNTTLDMQTTTGSQSQSGAGTLSPSEQKNIQETLNKYKNKVEDNQKALEELDKND